jgi:hypothetical protein
METENAKTPSGRPRGKLLSLRQAAGRVGMGESTLRQVLYAGVGPPALKRPASNRWLFWEGEIDDWLESGRVKLA